MMCPLDLTGSSQVRRLVQPSLTDIARHFSGPSGMVAIDGGGAGTIGVVPGGTDGSDMKSRGGGSLTTTSIPNSRAFSVVRSVRSSGGAAVT